MRYEKPSTKIENFLMDVVIDDNGATSESDTSRVAAFINANGESAYSISNAHSGDHAGKRSEADVLNEMMNRDTVRRIDGQFKTEHAQMGMTCELLHGMSRILDRYKENNDYGRSNNLRYSVDLREYFGDDLTSSGFMEIDGFIYPYETKSCGTIIMKNDMTSKQAPLGFTAQSVYPGWSFVPYQVLKQVDGEKAVAYLKERIKDAKSKSPRELDKEAERLYTEKQAYSKKRLSPSDFAKYGIKSGALTIPQKNVCKVLEQTDIYKKSNNITKFCYELKCSRKLAYPPDGIYDPDKKPDIRIDLPKADVKDSTKWSFIIHKDGPKGSDIRLFVEANGQFTIKRFDLVDPKTGSKKFIRNGDLDTSDNIAYYPITSAREQTRAEKFAKASPEQAYMLKLAKTLYKRFDDRKKEYEAHRNLHQRGYEPELQIGADVPSGPTDDISRK
jgi:hypothetical protein